MGGSSIKTHHRGREPKAWTYPWDPLSMPDEDLDARSQDIVIHGKNRLSTHWRKSFPRSSYLTTMLSKPHDSAPILLLILTLSLRIKDLSRQSRIRPLRVLISARHIHKTSQTPILIRCGLLSVHAYDYRRQFGGSAVSRNDSDRYHSSIAHKLIARRRARPLNSSLSLLQAYLGALYQHLLRVIHHRTVSLDIKLGDKHQHMEEGQNPGYHNIISQFESESVLPRHVRVQSTAHKSFGSIPNDPNPSWPPSF